MHLSRANLGLKLNMALLAFFVMFGVATSVVLVYGFNRTQEDATERSEAALAELGSLALSAVVSGAAEQGGLQFETASEIGQRAARHMESFRDVGGSIPPIESARLARTDAGLYYDPAPDRTSDLLILGGASPDAPGVREDMAYSASLNAVFDGLFQGFSDDVGGRNFDASAISFLGLSGVTLYYPPIGLHELAAPDADPAPLFERLGPIANPERRTIWREPYEDGAGLGLVITAETPVYDGDTFRGVMQVDILIHQLVAQINVIKPTPRSFAFYVDNSGNLMRSDAFELLETESAVNADLASILNAMRDEQTENETIVERVIFKGEDFFVAHAPMPSIGGSFGVAAPVAEITSEAAAITAGIEDEGARTLLVMLAAMAGLVIVGLIAGSQINRRVLLNPITRLVSGTQAVAAGELRTELPIRSADELGQLAEAFNQMTTGLRESERMLEQRVEERTRELALLLDVSQDVASTLDLQELARLILQQLRAVITYDGAGVLLLDGPEVTVLEARDGSGAQDVELVGQRFPLPLAGPAGDAIERESPVIVADAQADEVLAEESLTVPGRAASGRSWLAAPLLRKSVWWACSRSGRQSRTYTDRSTQNSRWRWQARPPSRSRMRGSSSRRPHSPHSRSGNDWHVNSMTPSRRRCMGLRSARRPLANSSTRTHRGRSSLSSTCSHSRKPDSRRCAHSFSSCVPSPLPARDWYPRSRSKRLPLARDTTLMSLRR